MTKIISKKIVDKMSDNEVLDWIFIEVMTNIPPQSELSRRIRKLRLKLCTPLPLYKF